MDHGDGESSRVRISGVAEQVASAIGYDTRIGGPMFGYPASFDGWVDATYEPPRGKKPPKYVTPHDRVYKKLVVMPRELFVSHPDYMLWIRPDSSNVTWIVYSEGNIAELERQLMPLMKQDNDPWPKILKGWNLDLERRKAITRRRWDTPTSSTRTTLHPDQLETKPDLSTLRTSKTVPTFGDLSYTAKPSRTKR